MRKIAVFLAGPAGKNFFWLFLSKTFSLGLFRNFLDPAIRDPRHHPQKVPVPPGSITIKIQKKIILVINEVEYVNKTL